MPSCSDFYKTSMFFMLSKNGGLVKVTKLLTSIFSLLQLTVIQGDVSQVEADALVHPTNATFYLGGEVGMYTSGM